MHIESLENYRCPVSGSQLQIAEGADIANGVMSSGRLISDVAEYPVENGLPVFAVTESLQGDAVFARQYYASIADSYDENVHVTFDLYNESELDVRLGMIELLQLKPGSKVLEISAGTGRDSELIVKKLGADGELWLLDISPAMLEKARQRLAGAEVKTEFAVGNACQLPYPSGSFDALYCFAGIGHFPDQRAGLQEMARVVRPGGRVVFCEKNVPPWLRKTTYGKILINNNPMFADPAPLELIPVEARNVGIRWILGNVHYVVDYTVGEGEPQGDFDLEMPGQRGGTFNTRFYGKLDGVTAETKKKAIEAQKLTGKSMHKWLDEIILKEANDILHKGK